jgi:uncharacterized protein YutE (UPF0331/DUF86 family)
MEKEKLVIVKSDVDSQLREIESLYDKISEREKIKSEYAIESIAYQLHNVYCAIEDVFKIIAAAFENNVEDKSKYHAELLKRMTQTFEGIRPNVISKETYRMLDNLRAFRHFFRHAYSYEIDERKVRLVLEDAKKVKEMFFSDIVKFLEKIS